MGRLAPKGSVIEVPSTGTDMSSFEDGWDDDPWCHVVETPGRTLCGCRDPRPDEPIHHDDDPLGSICTGCGKPKCPDCEWLGWER